MRSRRGALWRFAAAGLACALLAGCASSRVAAGKERELAASLRQRGLDPAQIIVPFALTDEMKAWAHANVPTGRSADDRLKALLQALIAKAGLQLEYESDRTATAAEVFGDHKANCLAFANLFLGMARELGLAVYFVEVRDLQNFIREGDLVIVSGHVTAGFGPPEQRTLLDFTLGQTASYRQISPISDLRAIAMYYSNRGARMLRDNDVDSARRWLETAVAIDPELAGGWVNLGVARRRTGDEAGAEAAYRKALEADPTMLSAYQNLAVLLRRQGKEAEAVELLALTDRKDNRNPFNYLDLGDLALRHDRLAEAERFYRKALRLSRDDPEPYAAMGLLALRGGRAEDAQRWLQRARKQSGARGVHTSELESRLEHPTSASRKPA